MTPNIAKGFKDTSKFAPEAPDSVKASANDASGNNFSAYNSTGKMDGDHAAKTMDDAATSAATAGTDLSEGVHETARQGAAAGDKATGHGISMFNASGGSVGQAFTSGGAIGGTAEKAGGPFSSQGMVGKHFTEQGAVGGTFQKLAEMNETH